MTGFFPVRYEVTPAPPTTTSTPPSSTPESLSPTTTLQDVTLETQTETAILDSMEFDDGESNLTQWILIGAGSLIM